MTHSNRTPFTLLAITLIAMFANPMLAQQTTTPPQGNQQADTMAVVNGQPITRQQLANQCVSRFGNDVLKGIIKKQLVFGECQRLGINITEKDINDEITLKASQFKMSAEHYINVICSRRNLTPDRLKNDFIWHDVALRRLAAEEIQVTPEELQRQIDIEYGSKVQVREIVCGNLAEAQEIMKMISGPNALDFGTVAKDYSKNPQSAAIRGLLPPVPRHVSNNKQMEEIIFSMQPGQITDPIEVAEDQYIILKCEKIFPAYELSQEQLTSVHERLVQQISEAKLTTAAQTLANKLQNTAKIVNVHNDAKLSQEMPGVAAIVNGTRITKRHLAEECIAQFGVGMLDSEISRLILSQQLQARGIQVVADDIKEEIERAAEWYGYQNADGSINIDAWIQYRTRNDSAKVDFYIEDEVRPSAALRKLVVDRVKVTDDDLKKGFESNFGPRVEALMIVFNDHRQATKVWQMAMANPTAKYFGQLANQYSVDPTSQNNSGEVPPIPMHGGFDNLEKEAFNLKENEISKIVQVNEQYVILMCRGRTTPRVTNFEDVRTQLHKDIFEKKLRIAMDGEMNRLLEAAQIDNFLVGSSQAGTSARTANQAGSNGLRNRKP